MEDTVKLRYQMILPCFGIILSGGTFDHLTGYKSLLRRLGHICGLCGHQSTSSTTLLRHISTTHGRQWDSITSYAEWLQTSSALRNVGCTCLRPPAQPHVCTIFSQLALFVRYDLTKFRAASAGTVLAHALKLDLQVLSPTLELNFPELDTNLTRGNFEMLKNSAQHLAYGAVCGRQIDPRDLLQHLWNSHAKHCNRGSLFQKYLTSFQQRQPSCSICEPHPAAAQCPALLQIAALLAILHHGHGQQRSGLGDVGGPGHLDEDGGGRGGKDQNQTATVHHVEWREGPGQRKRKKRAGEDAEHQGRVHTRFKDAATDPVQTRSQTRRQSSVSGHGDGLLRFFERGSRIHSQAADHNRTLKLQFTDSVLQTSPAYNWIDSTPLERNAALEFTGVPRYGFLTSLATVWSWTTCRMRSVPWLLT